MFTKLLNGIKDVARNVWECVRNTWTSLTGQERLSLKIAVVAIGCQVLAGAVMWWYLMVVPALVIPVCTGYSAFSRFCEAWKGQKGGRA